jgi:hypothetical protein
VIRVSVRRPSRLPWRPAASLALVASALALGACSEVESNLREVYPYKVTPIKGSDLQRVSMADETAALLPVRTATVQRQGSRKVVPHDALIYNPDGDAFVYAKPRAETYVRAPIEIVRVTGDRVVLSGGPPVGATVVTTGSAELLATEYEILNQHP